MRRTLLLASMALLAGCAPGDPGLVIQNVVAPNEQCMYDVGNAMTSHGTYDLAGGGGYFATLRLGNQLIDLGNNGTTGTPRANPNVIMVQEFEVEITDTASSTLELGGLPNPYTVPAGGGVVPSSDGNSAGEALGTVTLIPPVYGDSLGEGEIVVRMRAVGTTVGGAEVVSSEFVFPITVCNGCLFDCRFDDEGEPVCAPSCTPGQDSMHVTPELCGGMFADRLCAAGGG